MFKLNEAIEVKVLLLDDNGDPIAGTIAYTVYDEADVSFATGNMTAIAVETGLYTLSFTPDAVGEWTVVFDCTSPNRSASKTFYVGKGVEADIHNIIKAGGAGDLAALLIESQSHPTLDEIEATAVLAKEATLALVKTETDKIPAHITALTTHDTDIKTLVDEIETYLKHGTYGLAALNTDLNFIIGMLNAIQIDLDNPDQYKADLSVLDRHLTIIDCWSDEVATVTITGGSTDVNLPDVIIPTLPTGATIWKVVLIFKCALIRDTSGFDNAINGAAAIRIKKSGGSWGVDDIVAYDIVDNLWLVDVSVSTDRAGDVFIGNINNDNLSGEVDGAATYNLRFEDIQADGANLVLYEVCVGLRVYFY